MAPYKSKATTLMKYVSPEKTFYMVVVNGQVMCEFPLNPGDVVSMEELEETFPLKESVSGSDGSYSATVNRHRPSGVITDIEVDGQFTFQDGMDEITLSFGGVEVPTDETTFPERVRFTDFKVEDQHGNEAEYDIVLKHNWNVKGELVATFDNPEPYNILVSGEEALQKNIQEIVKVVTEKQTSGKPPTSRIPYEAIMACAEVFDFGSKKYEWGGYKRNPPTVLECTDALVRHAYKLANGEQLDIGPNGEFGETDDPETNMKWSGLHHVGHMLCCAAMMAWVIENRPDLNDTLSDEERERTAYNKFMSVNHGGRVIIAAEDLEKGDMVFMEELIAHKALEEGE